MRSALRKAVTAFSTVMLLGAMSLPSFASTNGATDNGPGFPQNTVEPIKLKAETFWNNTNFRTDGLQSGNITGFSFTADPINDTISATITTKGDIVKCLPAAPFCAGINSAPYSIAAPYGGMHVMVLFQTPELNNESVVGCADVACLGDSAWQRARPEDRFYWFLYYGATVSEENPDIALGLYDPAGRLVGLPLEPGVGQIFGVLGQNTTSCNTTTTFPGSGDLPAGKSNNASVTFPTAKSVTISIPYLYKWRLPDTNAFPCGARQKQIAGSGSAYGTTLAADSIKNIVAFSWADHEIGGPEPVGLILGWTWYLDSVPAAMGSKGYKFGTPSGDPSAASFALQNCPANTRGVDGAPPPYNNPGQRSPLYDGQPCMFPNPVGPGFIASDINVTA